MPTTVDVPDFGSIDFPDEMSLDDIRGALRKRFPPQSASALDAAKDAASYLGRQTAVMGGQVISGATRGASLVGELADITPDPLRPLTTVRAHRMMDLPPIPQTQREKQQFLLGRELALQQRKEPTAKSEEGVAFQFGQQIREEAKGYYSDRLEKDHPVAAALISGVASTIPVIASGPFAPLAYASMMGEQGVEEAKAAGRPDAASAAFFANAALGLGSEFALGIPALLRSVKVIKGGEQAASELGRRVQAIYRAYPITSLAIRQGITEGIQEGPIEQTGSNAIASYVAGYDPERPIFKDVAEQAAYGAAIGMLLGGLFGGAAKVDKARAEERAAFAIPEGDFIFQDPVTGQWLNAADYAARQGLKPESAQRGVRELPKPFLDVEMEVMLPPGPPPTQRTRVAAQLPPGPPPTTRIAPGVAEVIVESTPFKAPIEIPILTDLGRRLASVRGAVNPVTGQTSIKRIHIRDPETGIYESLLAPEGKEFDTWEEAQQAGLDLIRATFKEIKVVEQPPAIISRGRFRPAPVSQITGRPQTVTSAPREGPVREADEGPMKKVVGSEEFVEPKKAPLTLEQEYGASLEAFKKASADFTKIRDAYRKREIGDAEFIAGRKAFDDAQTVADVAERKFIDAKNAPTVLTPDQEYDASLAAFEEASTAFWQIAADIEAKNTPKEEPKAPPVIKQSLTTETPANPPRDYLLGKTHDGNWFIDQERSAANVPVIIARHTKTGEAFMWSDQLGGDWIRDASLDKVPVEVRGEVKAEAKPVTPPPLDMSAKDIQFSIDTRRVEQQTLEQKSKKMSAVDKRTWNELQKQIDALAAQKAAGLDSKGRTPEKRAMLNKMAVAVKAATATEGILPKPKEPVLKAGNVNTTSDVQGAQASKPLGTQSEFSPKVAKQQKKFLLDAVDQAIAEAPDVTSEEHAKLWQASEQYKAKKAYEEWSKNNPYPKAPESRDFGYDKESEGFKAAQAQFETDTEAWNAKRESEMSALAEPYRAHSYVGATSGEALTQGTEVAFYRSLPHVTIEVPGDGTFSIVNWKSSLEAFKERAAKFPTTAAKIKQPSQARTSATAAAPLGKPDKAGALAALAPTTAAASDEGRKILWNIWSDGKQSVAVNGRMLTLVRIGLGGTVAKPILVTIEGKPSQLEEGAKFPNWTHVVPENLTESMNNLDTEKLFIVLRQAQETTSDKAISVKLWRNPDGSLGVTSNDVETGSYEHNVQGEASTVIMAIDPAYLINAINAARRVGDKTVSLEWLDELSPLKVSSKNTFSIIMPMRLSSGIERGTNEGANTNAANSAGVAVRLEQSGEVLWGTASEINEVLARSGQPRVGQPGTARQGELAEARGVRAGEEAASAAPVQKTRIFIPTDTATPAARKNSDILAHRILYGSWGPSDSAVELLGHNAFGFALWTKLNKPRVIFRRLPAEPGRIAPIMRYDRIPEIGDFISINIDQIGNYDLADPEQRAELDAALSEELLHAATMRLSSDEEIRAVWQSLSAKEKADVRDIYPNVGNDFEGGAEYVRLILQERLVGTVTEQHRWRITDSIKRVLQKLVNLLKQAFGEKPADNIARQVIERIEGAIKGDAPIAGSVFGSGEVLRSGIERAAQEGNRDDDMAFSYQLNAQKLNGSIMERFVQILKERNAPAGLQKYFSDLLDWHRVRDRLRSLESETEPKLREIFFGDLGKRFSRGENETLPEFSDRRKAMPEYQAVYAPYKAKREALEDIQRDITERFDEDRPGYATSMYDLLHIVEHAGDVVSYPHYEGLNSKNQAQLANELGAEWYRLRGKGGESSVFDQSQYAAPQQGASTVQQVTTEALAFLGVQKLPASITVINDPTKPFGAVITNRNTITLNAAKIAPGTVGKVLLEEGLHGVWFQPEVQSVMAAARKSVTQSDIAAEKAKRAGLDTDEATLIEEATIAKLVNRSFWNRMLDAIKRAFRRVFGIEINPNSYEGLREAAMNFLRGQRGNLPGKRLVASNAVVVAPGLSPAYAITAHHGTPHEVDRFSTEYIGTGEGAQVYGWGLYFAGNPLVSAEYARKLGASAYPSIETLKKYFTPGNIVPSYGGGTDRVISFRGENNQDWSVTVITVRENATGIVENIGVPREHRTPPSAANLEKAGLRPGREYTVTLNVEQDELLDWDRPLSEQSDTVKEAIRNSGASLELMALMHGSEIYRELMRGMSDSDFQFAKGEVSKRTSELASLGIKGIRYLDQGSRLPNIARLRSLLSDTKRSLAEWQLNTTHSQETRKNMIQNLQVEIRDRELLIRQTEIAPPPTYNFVIFNSDDITITHRNGQPVAIEEAIVDKVRYAAPTVESTTTRVLGLDEAALRRVIKPEDLAQGRRDAERLYDEAGIPWRRTSSNLLVPQNLGAVTEANLQSLIAIAKRELDPLLQAGLAQPDAPFNDRRANFNNSIRIWAEQMRSDIYGGRHTRLPMALFDELFAVTQGEVSEAGKKLYLHKEPQIDEMKRIASAPEAELIKVWKEQYDGGPVQSTLQAIRLYFQNFFDVDQIDTVLAAHPDAGAFLDELLGDSVVSPKPTVQQMIQAIFATPIYRHAELGQRLVRILTEQLGIPLARANEAARIFNTAFAESIDTAWKKALAQAQDRLTPKEKSIAGPGTKLWKKLQDFVNSKGADDYEFFRSWVKDMGGSPPTDADINQLRAASERAQQLLELTPRQLGEVAANPTQEDAIKRWLADATVDERAELHKRMVTLWKRFTRPLGWKHWFAGADIAFNNAQAINEFAAGNILSRLTFVTKQAIDIGTTNLFYTPQRALAHAFQRYINARNLGEDDAGARADLWKDITESLSEAYAVRNKTIGARFNALGQGIVGRGLPQNVEGIKGGTHAYDRIQLRVNELLAEGTPQARAKAFVYLIGGIGQMGFRVAGALDVFQGVPIEFQEIRQQVVTELRSQGKPRAVAMQQADEVIGDIQSARTLALAEARAILEESAAPGQTFTDGQVSKSAWEMVKGQMYIRIKALGLNSDEFEARNNLTRQLYGWNLPEEGGLGGAFAKFTKGTQDFFARMGLPTGGIAAFGNAIGTLINRKLTWAGLGFLPGAFKGSPWYGNELEVLHRKAEAGTGLATGAVAFLLSATGVIIIHSLWPDDPKERERWEREGIRPGTAEIPLGDGTSIHLSATTGPLSYIGPYLAAGGALFDLAKKRSERQAKADAEADRKGLARGEIDAISASEVVGVLSAAAQNAMFGGRTASGIKGAYSDYGKLDLKRSASSFAASFVPGLPAYSELTRLAGVSLDPKRASFWDLFVPMPNSTARRVNMLGDDVGNPDAVQRVTGMMTGGTSVRTGNVQDQGLAYANLFASSYRPPPLSAAKGYNFGGTFRPMNPREYGRYVEERGKAFKQELEQLGSLDGLGSDDARKAAQGAFQRANQRALASVGVSEIKPKRAYTRRLKSIGGITRRGRQSSLGRIRRGRTPGFGKLRPARAPRINRTILSGTLKQRVQRIVPANF